MDHTSFEIHPEKFKSKGEANFIDIGSLENYTWKNGIFEGQCEQGYVCIEVYTDKIIRVMMNPMNRSFDSVYQITDLKPNPEIGKLKEGKDHLLLQTKETIVKIQKSPFRINFTKGNGEKIVQEKDIGMGIKNSREVICYKMMEKIDNFYGFGEKTGFLNKRGEKLTMWNSDVYDPHNPETDPLYQSIPFFICLREGKAYGLFFNNPGKTIFDLQSETNVYSFHAETGIIDYYLFAGPTMKEVIGQYTSITGRMNIPPKWSLGYHQSRYSYETEEEVLELVSTFEKKQIPLDVVHLDIHYMEGYRVFTFDKSRFPNSERLINILKNKGIQVVPIVDPGVKADPEYFVFQQGIQNQSFCKFIDGEIYYGEVWPGKSALPDFTDAITRNWWGELHQFYTKLGIEGIWNDMNEPAVFNETKTMDVQVTHQNDGNPKTHRELHNLYGSFMAEATYNGLKRKLSGKRPFLLTRAGYAGIQKYAAVWTGDNRSFWEHLQMTLPMVMNLGLSGVPFAGSDVGGFAHDSNGELLTRWMQVGSLTPFFRNHSAIGTHRQEPWSFGEPYETIIKKYIELRYIWLPQLYTLFAYSHKTGLPVMRPLVLEYPEDLETYRLSNQFMIGDNTIVAPIMQPGGKARAVYLPQGRWVNYWTNEVLEGKGYHLVYADLEILPIFIKEGSMIAHGEEKKSTVEEDKRVSLHLYYGEPSNYHFVLYDDDGKTFKYEQDDYLKLRISIHCENNSIQLALKKEGHYTPKWKTLELIIHNGEGIPVYFDNREIFPTKKGIYIIRHNE